MIIEDNLSILTSRQVQMALLAWSELEVQFIPKYACCLNPLVEVAAIPGVEGSPVWDPERV